MLKSYKGKMKNIIYIFLYKYYGLGLGLRENIAKGGGKVPFTPLEHQ